MYREIALLGLMLAPVAAVAAPVVTLDLAAPVAEQAVDADTNVEVRIVNRLPGKDYHITIRRETIPIPHLESPLGARGADDDRCLVEVGRLSDALQEATDEKAVPGLIAGARTKMTGCPAGTLAALNDEIATTHLSLGEHRLARGQQLVIAVRREERTWTFALSPGARGEWRTYYGFTFLPDADEEFFAQQDPADATRFIVTEEEDRRELDFAPSILFAWMPASQRNRNWSHGLAAGLGFDLDNPIVFGGYALTYNENIALTLGVVFHKQARLAGRFEEGQSIGEDLDSEQLTDDTYGVNGYFGIAFRFDSNPFAKQSE